MRRPRLPLLAAACAVAVAAPTTAHAAVSVGQSGWTWGSPLPQGNTLRAIDLIGSRGYASGAFGTVLRTDDGGATWTGLTTGVTADLNRLRVLGPDGFVVGGGCVLRRTDDGGRSFKRLPFSASESACPTTLSSFSFPSSDTGYLLLADGTVTRTDDGGQTFSGRTAVPATRASGGDSNPTDVAFTSAEKGVAITSGSQPRIYRTTDGARSWTVVQSSGAGLRSLTFVDDKTGYAVGEGSTLFATTDGGETWERRDLAVDSPPTTLTGLRCADADTCLIATEPGDRLLRTTDGGATARAISPSTDPIYAAGFGGKDRVVGVGAQGTTVVSDDGGLNYAPVGGRLPGHYTGVRAASASVAYAMGTNGALARTTDGGQTWKPGAVSTAEDIRDVSFPTEETGFALDTAGGLLRTDNATASWKTLNTGASSPPLAVLAPSKDVVVLVGRRGLRRSVNGGGEFTPVPQRKVAHALLSGADQAGSALVAYGPKALFVSSDAGATWKALRRPKKQYLGSVDFQSARSGYAIDEENRIYRTRNAGRTWTELPSVGGTRPVGLAFADPTAGWALLPGFGRAGSGGYVLRTDDGGASWRPQLISQQPLPDGGYAEPFLAATSTRSAIALAGGRDPSGAERLPARLFATTTGGDAGVESTLSLKGSARSVKAGRSVTISGRLTPPEGGETAVVWSRESRSVGWAEADLPIASDGTFSRAFKLRRTTTFVAQWQGDDDRRSDGTTAVTVKVPAKAKAKRRR